MPHHFACIIAVACLCLAMPLASSQCLDATNDPNISSWNNITYPVWMKNSTSEDMKKTAWANDEGRYKASIPLWGLSNLTIDVKGQRAISFRWNCSAKSDSMGVILRDGGIEKSGLFFLIDGEVKANCTSSKGDEIIWDIHEGDHQLTWTLSRKVKDRKEITGWIEEICITSPKPNCTIDASDWAVANSPARASVPFAGARAQYDWSIAGGTVESDSGTQSITWSYPRAGLANITVTVTRNGTKASCSKLVNVWECSISAPDKVAPGTNQTASVPYAGPEATYYWLIEGGEIISGQSERNFAWRAGEGDSAVLIATVTINGIPYHCSKTVYIAGECRIAAPNKVVAGSTSSAQVNNIGQRGTPEWSIDGRRILAGQRTDRIAWTADWPGEAVISVAVPGTNLRCNKTIEVQPNCNITAPQEACAWQPNLTASVRDSGPNASYSWGVSGGELLRGQGTPQIEWKAGRGETDMISVEVRANGTDNIGTRRIPINESCVYLTYCDDLQGEIDKAKDPMEIILTCEPCGSQSSYGPILIENKDNLTIRSECMAKIVSGSVPEAVIIDHSNNIHFDSFDITRSMYGRGDASNPDRNSTLLLNCSNNSIITNCRFSLATDQRAIYIYKSSNTRIIDNEIEPPGSIAICVIHSPGTRVSNSLDDGDLFYEINGSTEVWCYLYDISEYRCCKNDEPTDIMKDDNFARVADLGTRNYSGLECP